jgi:peptidoglycan/xylan/chitin deacetylase (PgdA/CDA1 family)
MFWIKPPLRFKPYLPNALWQMENAEKVIYLTFDDGPHPETTPFILDTLAKYNWTATFFCLGKQVEQHPDLYHQMISNHHAIGNHGYQHLNGWSTKKSDYAADLQLAKKFISSNLFRPPYGKLSFGQNKMLQKEFKVVMWSLMPEDFRADLSSEIILDRLIENVGARNIVVLHENDKSKTHLLKILPQYLSFLYDHGFSVKKLPYVD